MQKWSLCTSTVPLEFTLHTAARGFFRKGKFHNVISLCYKQNQPPRTKSREGLPVLHVSCLSLPTHLRPSSCFAVQCALATLSLLFFFPHIPLQSVYTCCNILSSFYTALSPMAVFLPSASFQLEMVSSPRQAFPDKSILTALLVMLEPINLFYFLHSTHPYVMWLTYL